MKCIFAFFIFILSFVAFSEDNSSWWSSLTTSELEDFGDAIFEETSYRNYRIIQSSDSHSNIIILGNSLTNPNQTCFFSANFENGNLDYEYAWSITFWPDEQSYPDFGLLMEWPEPSDPFYYWIDSGPSYSGDCLAQTVSLSPGAFNEIGMPLSEMDIDCLEGNHLYIRFRENIFTFDISLLKEAINSNTTD